MKDFILRLKFIYAIYNFFHRKELLHNVPILKRYGLRKRYYSSLSSRDFAGISDAPDTVANKSVQSTPLYQQMDQDNRKSILAFEENGFIVLRNYLSPEVVDRANENIASLLAAKRIRFRFGNKIMFAIHQSDLLKQIGENKELIDFLSVLMHGEAKLFQSINFYKGSEQHTHSDSIHMTTFPTGGLLGVWIALEDVNEENGPLHYYPGSHRLPYYLNADFNNEGSKFLLGRHSYDDYERMIEEKIREKGLRKEVFMAKKGDALIWHANLFHGGEPHINKEATRKSMVLHYFNNNAVCYHEITQRPALLRPL